MAFSPTPPPGKQAKPTPATAPRINRLPLSGSRSRQLRFELRLKLWFLALSLPAIALTAALTLDLTSSIPFAILLSAAVALTWAIATSILFERIVRPLQTMSNVVAALCEDDFSFRARGARRGDSMGDLALEINALASTLQRQRLSAVDALSLVEIVMNSMSSPVLAFDADRRLRLLNPSAEVAFHLQSSRSMGQPASELELGRLFTEPGTVDTGGRVPVLAADDISASNNLFSGRWSIHRTAFRLQGVPHTLFVLADVSAALRDEERIAWQRLIRVLGHEINNSLAPIKSIAGSLRSQLPMSGRGPADFATLDKSMERGLSVIEERAESLNRFLKAYQKFTRLPAPSLQPLPIQPLLRQVAQLETRMAVHILTGPAATILGDADQLQQLFINLIRNAADATLERTGNGEPSAVDICWRTTSTHAIVHIIDNGEGLLNEANLFVPFYTTKPEGTGIGLVLAQQIATAHNGSLRLFNRVEQTGCIAEVSFPLLSHGNAGI